MSEFQVRVVQLGEIRKHPGADNLSITEIGGAGGYPVILRTGELQQGDKAVYIPVGALLPADDSRWDFLRKPGERQGNRGLPVIRVASRPTAPGPRRRAARRSGCGRFAGEWSPARAP